MPPAADAVDISVVVCTHNRGQMLRDTLASYAAMAVQSSARGELLIVDNNSGDDTASIAREFVRSHAGTTYVFEARPGLSHARNTGIREARAGIIAFADDDVYFQPGWLDALVSAFAAFPGAGCAGGRTEPLFEAGAPSWLHDTLLYMYGSTDCGDAPSWMEFPKHPFGVNMAFRREVFDRIGGFDPRLGRVGESLLSGEESDIFRRAHEAGYRTRYVPEARLRHRIPSCRTNPQWALERSYWQGVSDVVFGQLHEPLGRVALIGIVRQEAAWLLRHHTGGHLNPRRILWHRRSMPLHAKCWAEVRRGRLRQALKEVLTRPTPRLQAPPTSPVSTASQG
jgi:GT2 family glycosyltransferase